MSPRTSRGATVPCRALRPVPGVRAVASAYHGYLQDWGPVRKQTGQPVQIAGRRSGPAHLQRQPPPRGICNHPANRGRIRNPVEGRVVAKPICRVQELLRQLRRPSPASSRSPEWWNWADPGMTGPHTIASSSLSRRSPLPAVAAAPARPRTTGLGLTRRQTSAARGAIRCTGRRMTRQAVRQRLGERVDGIELAADSGKFRLTRGIRAKSERGLGGLGGWHALPE
jgi:hypothetical protein